MSNYCPSVSDIQTWLRWAARVATHPAKAHKYYLENQEVIDKVCAWHDRTREEWKRQQNWESWKRHQQEKEMVMEKMLNHMKGGNDDYD